MVYSCLDSEPLHAEEIAARAGLSVSQSMDVLLYSWSWKAMQCGQQVCTMSEGIYDMAPRGN